MPLTWTRESAPSWNADRQRVLGSAPEGALRLEGMKEAPVLSGSWWRVEEARQVVGYGWMDVSWGDGEILLAVAASAQGHGVGTFILDRLEEEASRQGLSYIFNTVRTTHPDREGISRWLQMRGFHPADDGQRLQRQVRRP